jgi:O-antigen ligase
MASDFLTKWINFWVFIFSITVLSYSGHGGQSAIVLLLTILYVVIAKRKELIKLVLHKEEKMFIYLVLAFWGWQLFGVLYQPLGFELEDIRAQLRAFDYPARWILLLPIFFLFRRFLIDWRVVSIGMSIGVFITVGIAIYQVHYLDLERATGGVNNAIPFGELMVAVDLLLWMLMIYAWNNGRKIISSILLISSIVAFYGSLLSVTRGAWIAYIFMIFIWLVHALKKSMRNKKYLFSLPVILRILFAILVFYMVTQTQQYKVLERSTKVTITALSYSNYNNATNGRVSIYKDSINSIKNYPFGIGTDNFTSIKQTADKKNQAHNELLNIWVENGIQGVITFLLLFVYLFKYFWKYLNHKQELVGFYAACGLMLITSYAIFGQSQSVFSHHSTLIFFIFYLYFFFAQIQLLIRDYK